MSDITIDALVEAYRNLRDKKAAITKVYDEAMAPIKTLMVSVEAQLLDRLNAAGVESARTSHGTAFKVTKRSFRVVDPDTFRAWATQSGNVALFESRVASTAVQAFIDNSGTLPPGLETNAVTTINVRK